MSTAVNGGTTATLSVGAGGKFRKRPFRRNQTTPYVRPLTALGRNPNWLTKLFASGAHRFFSSIFKKRLPPPPEASREAKTLPQEPCPNDHAGAVVGGAHEVCNAACSSEGTAFTEFEQLLKQKTFTRAEIDRLTELLHSKTVDTPLGNDKIAEAIYYRPLPDFSSYSLEKNRSQKVTSDAAIATPVTSSRVPKDDAASPAELAKAYMGTRPSKVSPSVLNSQSQIVTVDSPLVKDVAYSQSLPIITSVTRKTAGLVEVQANGFLTPRSRGRSAIYSMARAPYSRIRQTDVQMSLKRRSSDLESDLGSVGPMRRTRQKPNLLSHTVSRPSPGAGVASAAVVHHEVSKVVGDSEDNATTPTRYVHIPLKSSETATKILKHLDTEKPSESKLAAGKDTTPTKLTPNMRCGQALKSLKSLDSPKLLQSSAQDSHKLENWSKVVPPNARDSSLEKQGKIEENEQKKLNELTVVAKKDAGFLFEDAQRVVETADSLDKKSAAQPPRKQGFRMSAPEYSFEMDEDINTDDSASVLAEGRDKMGTSGAEKKSLSIDEALNKPEAFLAKKAPLGSLTKRNDTETPDAAVTSVKSTGSLPSAGPLPLVVTQASFGSDKSKESNVDKVPAFLSSSSPLHTGLKTESSSSPSNPASGPAGALSKLYELDNLKKDGKSSCKLEALSSGPSPSTSLAAPSSTSSFSNGQFSPNPAFSATSDLASVSVPKDFQFGSSSKIAPSTSLSATVTSYSSLNVSTAASSVSTAPIFKFGSCEVPPTDSALSTTSSADNADLKTKATNFGNLNNNSSFVGSLTEPANPGNSIFGFSSSGMSTVTTANIQSQSSVFSTIAQTSLAGSDNASVSQSASAHFGSSTSSPEVGNSGMTSFSSVGSASSNTAIVSASSDSNLVGSGAAASVKFSFGVNSSTSSVTPSSGTTQLPFTFGAIPATSAAATTALATSSNAASGLFGVNLSSLSNAVDTSTHPSPTIFNSGGGSSAFSLNNVSTPSTTAPSVFSFGGGFSTSSTNAVSTPTTPSIFGFGGSTSSPSTNVVEASATATPGIFGFVGSSSVSLTNAVIASTTVSPSPFAFGATSASSQTSTPAGIFSSSWQPQKPPGFSSTTPGFTFGATSSSFTPPSTTAVVFGSAPSISSGPPFLFGSTSSTNPTSQTIFGNSISPFTSSLGNNGQMNTEESMAEDPVQASSAAVLFNQPSVSPSPGGIVFGLTPSPFQFGGQQIQPPGQNPSPFAASGSVDFGGGGSFSWGSNDKSGRRIVKPNRNKNRRK